MKCLDVPIRPLFLSEEAARDEEAFRCIRTAHGISPDNLAVQALWPDYEDWDKEA